MRKEKAPEEFKHLFDTPIYSIQKKHYYKYTIDEIWNFPKDFKLNRLVTLIMTRNGYRKPTKFIKRFACELNAQNQYELRPLNPFWVTNITDVFLNSVGAKRVIDKLVTSPGYQYDLSNNKKKYPEHWL